MEEKKNGNGLDFKVGTRELIIIISAIIGLVLTMNTRASNSDLAALDRRVSAIEERINAICEGQKDMKSTLVGISSDNKEILGRLGKIEGKIQ